MQIPNFLKDVRLPIHTGELAAVTSNYLTLSAYGKANKTTSSEFYAQCLVFEINGRARENIVDKIHAKYLRAVRREQLSEILN
jgi:hypothetical protein